MNRETKHAVSQLTKRGVSLVPAVQFVKNGKWHLFNNVTGKIACTRYRNKALKDSIDYEIKQYINNPNNCESCIQVLRDQCYMLELEKEMQ